MVGRACKDLSTVHVHERTAIGFLMVTCTDHVHRAFETKQGTRHGKRGAPLARTGFTGESADSRFLVVIRLSYGGVWLVASCRTDTFVLVIDVCWSVELLLKP